MLSRGKLLQLIPAIAMCLLSIVMTSCTLFSVGFTPHTMESARCKRDCTDTFHACHLYNCDASIVSCMDYCINIDKILTKREERLDDRRDRQ
jgi:hypothetical protein